jgi:hypothetical protein
MTTEHCPNGAYCLDHLLGNDLPAWRRLHGIPEPALAASPPAQTASERILAAIAERQRYLGWMNADEMLNVIREHREPALAAEGPPAPPSLDASVVEDARRWREAEAEGHIVDFTGTGYGLQHPPSCRPDLIGCRFNVWLADADEPDELPGRYRMTFDAAGTAEYDRLRP